MMPAKDPPFLLWLVIAAVLVGGLLLLLFAGTGCPKPCPEGTQTRITRDIAGLDCTCE